MITYIKIYEYNIYDRYNNTRRCKKQYVTYIHQYETYLQKLYKDKYVYIDIDRLMGNEHINIDT